MASASIEEYLETIYKLQEKGEKIRPSQVASALGISAPSVAEMTKKMDEMGLLIKDRQKGVHLTKKGVSRALELIRKHRISERFLYDLLDIPWDKIHDQACKLEHVVSKEMEDGLNKLLKNPETCPHGHIIPGNAKEKRDLIKLSNIKEGVPATIESVKEENPEVLRYLGSLKLKPGHEVTVEEKAPFNGPITLIVDNEKVTIGPEIAHLIYVKSIT